ncbi:hypothetical protein Hanom_Chr09g00827961 [Helianthus anomalus]
MIPIGLMESFKESHSVEKRSCLKCKKKSNISNIKPEGTECGYYVMKFMKEIAYDGVEVLDNDNVSLAIF